MNITELSINGETPNHPSLFSLEASQSCKVADFNGIKMQDTDW